MKHKNFLTKRCKNRVILWFLAVFLLFGIIFFFVYRDFIFEKLAYYFRDIGSDTVNSTLPNYFNALNLSKTESKPFFWSFYKGLGEISFSYYILHPLRYVLSLWRFITGESFWAYRFWAMANSAVVALFFAFAYFKTLRLSNLTATVFSLFFVFGGYFVVAGTWGHYHLVVKLLFLLFAFEQWLMKRRWYFFPFAVWLLGSNMFYLAQAALFMLFYSLVRFYDENDSLKGYLPLIFRMLGAGLLGLLAGLVNNFPSFYQMYNAPRVSGDAQLAKHLLQNPENIDAYLRNVTVILRFFSSDLLGTGTGFKGWYNYLEAPLFYIGLLPLILIFQFFANSDKRKKLLYGSLVLLALLIAFVPIIRHGFNFFIGNYYKGAVDFFVPFFILLPSAFAFEKLLEKKVNDLWLIAGTGILLILLHFPYFKNSPGIIDFDLKIVITLFLLAYAVLIYFAKNNKLLIFSLLLVVPIELAYLSSVSISRRDAYLMTEIKRDLAGYNDGTFEALDFIGKQDTTKFFRIEKDYSSGDAIHSSLNDPMVQGYFGTTRYSSFAQKYYVRFLENLELIKKGSEAQSRWITGVRGIPLLMDLVSVKYFLAKDFNTQLKFSGYDSVAVVNNILILENKYFLPLGITYDKYLTAQEFSKLSKFKKQVALLNAVVLENSEETFGLKHLDTALLPTIKTFNFDLYRKFTDSLKKEHLEIINFQHKKIKGKITVSSDKILFFSVPYDKGWIAEIEKDGNKKRLMPLLVDGGLMGIPLKAGSYKITLRYFPPYFKLTKWLSFLGIAVLFLTLVYGFVKKNR